MSSEIDHIESSWLDADPPSTVSDYIPVQHLGDAAGLFVAIVRTFDEADKSSLSMIVGPRGEKRAHEVTTLPDTKEGIAIARTIAPIVLRSLFLGAHWCSLPGAAGDGMTHQSFDVEFGGA